MYRIRHYVVSIRVQYSPGGSIFLLANSCSFGSFQAYHIWQGREQKFLLPRKWESRLDLLRRCTSLSVWKSKVDIFWVCFINRLNFRQKKPLLRKLVDICGFIDVLFSTIRKQKPWTQRRFPPSTFLSSFSNLFLCCCR